MAILRRAEKQAQSKIDRLSLELEQYRTRNLELEQELRASKGLTEAAKKDKDKLASKVLDLQDKLDTALVNAVINNDKLMSTEAQVDTLLAEKQKSSDERTALVQNVSELEVACERFRRRAVQRSRRQ